MNELLRKRARYLLADTLHEPVLFFDKKNLLADYNKEAAVSFPFSLLDMSKEQWVGWLLKVYFLKPMYFYGMLNGLA